MFLLNGTYVKPSESVEMKLNKHLEFLEKYFVENKFIFAGKCVPRNGRVILCNVKDRSEVEAIIQEDPFYQKNIMEYEIIEFLPTMVAEGSALI